MLPLLLHSFTCVSVLSGVSVSVAAAVTTETVVGVVGRTVVLPCHSPAANQRGVEVCWGKGEPSLFTCHDAVIHVTGERIMYRKSPRYSVSSTSSLSISSSQLSDSGFYHCRVQLSGPFNDQTSSVHLIIITPHHMVSDGEEDIGTQKTPHTLGYITRDVTEQTGSDVTGDNTTRPVVALAQVFSVQSFIGNTVRVSFIIFIPLLLTAIHRVWRSVSDRRLNQSQEEEEGSSV